VSWFSRWFRKDVEQDAGEPGTDDVFTPVFASPRRSRETPRLPGFSTSVSDMPTLDGGGAFARLRGLIAKGFTPSHPVARADMFAGRLTLLKSLIRSIEHQQLHIVIYGDRGIGKTSLLNVLTELATQARYLVTRIACSEEGDFTDVFRRVMATIPLLYHTDYDPTSEAVERGDSFADLLPAGPVTVSAVSDLLSKVGGTRVLVLLDEFDRNKVPAFNRAVAELVKDLSDRSARVQLVIAGVAANLSDLIASAPSIRRNIIGIPVRRMEDDEIAELVELGAKTSDIGFEKDAMASIIATSCGSPYLASLISQHSGLNAIDRESRTVSRGDVAIAIQTVSDELALRLSRDSLHQIDKVPDTARHTMAELAREAMVNGGIVPVDRLSDMLKKMQSPAKGVLDDVLQHLLNPIPNAPNGDLQFKEDGVSHYLWISNARNKL
jgi:Cdc6-like AAA superfamily ATPase